MVNTERMEETMQDLERAIFQVAEAIVPLDAPNVTPLEWSQPRLGGAPGGVPPRVLIWAVIMVDPVGDAQNADGTAGTDDAGTNWGDWPACVADLTPESAVIFQADAGIPLVTAALADRFRVAVVTPCEVPGSSARFVAVGVYV
jgi:hypothetical protein